jgi:ribose/xylose/arabinose/galactoside ABC-type transport system permease subunit
MNEEILHRLFQVVVYTGGFVSFWQITKHMPKAFHNFLEYLAVASATVCLGLPVVGIIEYILGGNIDITTMFTLCLCSVSLLSVLWMVLVSLSRSMQGKEQFKYVIL